MFYAYVPGLFILLVISHSEFRVNSHDHYTPLGRSASGLIIEVSSSQG